MWAGLRCCTPSISTHSSKGLRNAHFYLSDSIDDQEVASALFETAASWARTRGLNVLRGPLGFMALDGFGMLARGFEHRPALGIPYNFDYYLRLAKTWGFELEERVFSGYLSVAEMRANFPQRVLEVADKVRTRYGFGVKTFKSKHELKNWVAPRLADIYNQALTDIAGDPPLSQDEVAAVADNVLITNKDGEVIGFLFCVLDISEGIKKANGRLLPFGLFHLLLELRRTNWINLNGMGILPDYHGLGGTAVMYAELFRALEQFPRFEHADIVQISEFNPKSLSAPSGK